MQRKEKIQSLSSEGQSLYFLKRQLNLGRYGDQTDTIQEESIDTEEGTSEMNNPEFDDNDGWDPGA